MILQRRQILKDLGSLIDIKDAAFRNCAITDFHSIVWMFISVIVTMYRNAKVLQIYENDHCITTTKLLRRCIQNLNIVESFVPSAATMGGGFFVGILIGYAVKKVIKIVAVIVGLFLAGLAYLQSQ